MSLSKSILFRPISLIFLGIIGSMLFSCELREKDNWIIECGKTTAMELVGEWPFDEVRMVTNPDTLRPFSPSYCLDSTNCEFLRMDIAADQKYTLDYKLFRRRQDSLILDTLRGTETGLLNYNYCFYMNPDADTTTSDFKGRQIGEIVFLPLGGTQYVCDLEFNDSLFFVQRLRIDNIELSVTFRR